VVRLPLLSLGPPLRLVVKHRLGGLDMAVRRVRQRNLAVSFGILLVLGGGLIVLVVSSLRVRALGKLQMDFAAGVSHEIRTPLAVIQSAAYNLQTGAVHDRKAIEEYAVILQDEARRLSDMVNQVLLFAETASGPKKYELTPVDVTTIIERSIHNLSKAFNREEYEVLTDIQTDMPPVMADAAALTQCVQNLLSNAVKYGKSDRFVRIKIIASQDRDRREVQVTVADDGPGIAAADRSRLFDPFYRGAQVNPNIPGNGLGLHLVKRLMESQRGRVTFNNNPDGKGAYFTLHIPAAPVS
jgi:signal transduction histidine kinase